MTEKKDLPDWEAVTNDQMTFKMKVPGGWLYRISTYQGVAAAFIPEIEEGVIFRKSEVSIDPSSR